jgi:hypothetical protein
MQQIRKTLTVRVPDENSLSAPSSDPVDIFHDAIRRKNCVSAVYNRAAVEVAPHVVYSKHGDLFVDGVVLLRDGKPPKEVKLGTFKLAGLSEVKPTSRKFAPHAIFNGGDPKYADAAISVVSLRRPLIGG